MRSLTLAALLALAAVTASQAAVRGGRYMIVSCSATDHACQQASHRIFTTFSSCEAVRAHMTTQRNHALVCTGPGHPLPAGDHMAP